MRIWLHLLIIVLPSLLRAGDVHYLDLSRTNLIVKSLPFQISKVVDSTHKTNLGSIEHSNRGQRIPIRLYKGIDHSLDSFVVSADWNDTAQSFTLQVNLFEVEEFQIGTQEYASIDLNVSFMKHDSSTGESWEFYQACFAADALGINPSKKHVENVAVALTHCFKSFRLFLKSSGHLNNPTYSKRVSIKSVNRNPRQDAVYLTYESFRDNQKDHELDTLSLVDKSKTEDGGFLKISGSQSKLLNAWGMTYKGESFFRMGKFFYPIEFRKDTIVGLIASKHVEGHAGYIPIYTGAGAGVAAGLAVAAVALSAAIVMNELMNHSIEFILYEPSGEFMTPNDWKIKNSPKQVLVFCSPFMKKGVGVGIRVDQSEFCEIQKGQYFELKVGSKTNPEDVCFVNLDGDITCLTGFRAQSKMTYIEVLSTNKRGVELFELGAVDGLQIQRKIKRGKIVPACHTEQE